MSPEKPTGPYLRTAAAAEYIGSTESKLEKQRVEGTGPAYYKNGRIVLYTKADLDAYVLAQRRTSTSAQPAPAAA
jgi:hypothetical protein